MAQRTMVENLLAHDAQEGITAFLEKREPQWTKLRIMELRKLTVTNCTIDDREFNCDNHTAVMGNPVIRFMIRN